MHRRRLQAAGLSTLVAFCAAAAEPPSPSRPYASDETLWGTPSRIVRPDYPAAAAQAQQQGVVEIEGVVEGSGLLSGIVYKPATPAAEVFVPALTAVVPYWRFHVPMGNDCMPSPENVAARVEFVIEGGEPKIFTSYSRRREITNPNRKEGYDYKATRRVTVKYPRRMVQAGVEANVYTRMEVSASGEVMSVVAEAHATNVARPAQVGELAVFEEEARNTLMRWQYSPNPGNWKGCYTLTFRLKD